MDRPSAGTITLEGQDLGRLSRAWAKPETIVAQDIVWTPTAKRADIVLPATMQLEHLDLHHSYGHEWLQLNRPAIAPLGECRPNTEVFRGLARRLNFEPELFDVTDEQLARIAMWEESETVPPQLNGMFGQLNQYGIRLRWQWSKFLTDFVIDGL